MNKQKILFIGDELSSLNLAYDASIAFCEAALSKDFEVFWCEKKDVSLYNFELIINQVFQIHEASIHSVKHTKISKDNEHTLSFEDFDYCFVRLNPPFDESYLNLCWILNTQSKVKIINSPASLLNFHEKSFQFRALSEGVLEKKNLISTCLTDSVDVLQKFLNMHIKLGTKAFVTKPWLGYGGADVMLWHSTQDVIEYFKTAPEKIMIQPLVPNVKTDGDQRVIIVNGKVFCSFVRLPQENSIISNTAAGGIMELRTLTAEQMRISEKIAAFTLKHGVLFAGIDLIGEQVGEINITSPTGFRVYEKLTGKSVIYECFDELLQLK